MFRKSGFEFEAFDFAYIRWGIHNSLSHETCLQMSLYTNVPKVMSWQYIKVMVGSTALPWHQFRRQIQTDPPARLAIIWSRYEFNADGIIQNVHTPPTWKKQLPGRLLISTSSATQEREENPSWSRKSVRQVIREIGLSKSSVCCIFKILSSEK